jgi:hypothetical protein
MKNKSKNKNHSGARSKHHLPLLSRLIILLIGTITIISMLMMPAMQQTSGGGGAKVLVEGK